ncbi:MAG: uracil-DNA glycosylase [Treponemataceae bacterium]|nr:uracil-DNA glycosylase [Treponemataceae bacterium]
MTVEEQQMLLTHLDCILDYLNGGYHRPHPVYSVQEDSPLVSPKDILSKVPSPPEFFPPDSASLLPLEESLPGPSPEGDSLEKIAYEISLCHRCQLALGRTNTVPGEGVAHPIVLVIGEGPGADEDRTGRPFVGRAGQLLDKMLAAINLNRETNCYIANVVKCRPPNNRDPLPGEVTACRSYLERQIRLLQPRAILTVGRISAQALLATTEGISHLRGHQHKYQAIPLFATYHPSALLRNEALKRPAWEDLKLLRSYLTTIGAYGNG